MQIRTKNKTDSLDREKLSVEKSLKNSEYYENSLAPR